LESVELAVLSLLAHWKEDGAEKMARATVEAIDSLANVDTDRATVCLGYLRFSLGDDFNTILERTMEHGFLFSDNALTRAWLRQGRAEGEANVLLRQMNKRFGSVAEETTARIRVASIEQLERGSDAILDAKSLEEVLVAVGVC
ncbi:MAG: DUF4351 domain-containing protein, partial [Polyangiaceae bacterium]|nr:DUF4351 domain-containing protein [Polyangiaceae bacterium]